VKDPAQAQMILLGPRRLCYTRVVMNRRKYTTTRTKFYRRSPYRRRTRGAPWASLFFTLLLVLFLGVTLYASLLLYRSAREAVQAVGTHFAIPIELPSVGRLLGTGDHASRVNAAGPAPNPMAAQPQAVSLPQLPTASGDRRVNILLLGVDRRPGEKGPPRTDTIIVVSIDPKTGDTSMVSIPRDLWIPIPGYHFNAKINQAYSIGEVRKYPGGGPALIKKTVASLIGYPIDYYVLVDFNGFRKLIDLIGGVRICVPKPIVDKKFPTDNYGVEVLRIHAGCQIMNGDLALKYARTRHADSDYGRAHRQQQVILAVRNKVLQARMLPTLLARAPQILHSLSGSLETDLPLDQMVALARLAPKVTPKHIRQEVIDNRYGKETYAENGAWILVPNRERLRPLFDSMFAPRQNTADVEALRRLLTPTPTPISASRPPLDAAIRNEDAILVVLNGSGRAGMALRVTKWLEAQGFHVVQFGHLGGHVYPHSLLIVHNDRPRTREMLVQLFRIRPENVRHSQNLLSDVDMELFIGEDFDLPTR